MTFSCIRCKICNESNIEKFRKRIIRNKEYIVSICRTCEAEKSREYQRTHVAEQKEYRQKYRLEHRERIRSDKKIYDSENYVKNKEKINCRVKEYSRNNRDIINKNKRERRVKDPAYRLKYYFSNRIRKIIKNQKLKIKKKLVQQ